MVQAPKVSPVQQQYDPRVTEQQPFPEGGQPLTYDYDVAIVGGGIVGTTLAAALKDSGLKIAVIEAEPQAAAIAKGQAYAIHLSSSQFFQNLGVWDAIAPQVEYFQQVRLSDANYPHVVEFQPEDLRTDVLGYVAEHRVLLQELVNFLKTCDNVHSFCPVQVTATTPDRSGVEVQLRPSESALATDPPSDLPLSIRVRMVVAADGARSPLRQQADIATQGWAYWQSCVVATIAPEKPHNNIAYECFWPSGPFAILPARDNLCRIVWTAPHAEAQALLNLDEEQFMAKLTQQYGNQMGKLSLVGQRFLFPAKWMHATRYVDPRLALVGDAAHCCHPVGGQGLNLGIRDAAALAHILISAHQQGEDIGDVKILRRYQRWRRHQNLASLGFTDLLNRTFSNQWVPLVQLRRLVLRTMQFIPPIRILMLKFMAGLWGRAPR